MIPSLYKPFQLWAHTGRVLLYSDPHFNDPENIFLNPSYPGDEEQLAKINKGISKNDTLVILGDVGDVSFISRIQCRYKVLITGNHDAGASNYRKRTRNPYRKDVFGIIQRRRGPAAITTKKAYAGYAYKNRDKSKDAAK